MSEQNWFFRLSDFSGALEAWLVANPDAIFPNSRRLEALSIIRGGLEDVSISRSSISWGVPVRLVLTPFFQSLWILSSYNTT